MHILSGNPKDCQYFQAMSRVVVEKRTIDPLGRVTRLIKLTDSEANDMMNIASFSRQGVVIKQQWYC